MKILYLGTERGAAQIAANALRDLAPDVRLAWAGSLSAGLRWVDDNRDVKAMVVETDVQNQSCASFVDRVRGLGLTAPVIVVARPETGTPLEALKAGADDYVVNNESVLLRLARGRQPDAHGRAIGCPAHEKVAAASLRWGLDAGPAVFRESRFADRDRRSGGATERHVPTDLSRVSHRTAGVRRHAGRARSSWRRRLRDHQGCCRSQSASFGDSGRRVG